MLLVTMMPALGTVFPDDIVQWDAPPENWTANSSIAYLLHTSSTTNGMVDDEVFFTIDDTDDLHPLKLTFWAPQQHKAAFAAELLPVIIIVIIKLLEELIIIKVMPFVSYTYPSIVTCIAQKIIDYINIEVPYNAFFGVKVFLYPLKKYLNRWSSASWWQIKLARQEQGLLFLYTVIFCQLVDLIFLTSYYRKIFL